MHYNSYNNSLMSVLLSYFYLFIYLFFLDEENEARSVSQPARARGRFPAHQSDSDPSHTPLHPDG